MKVAVATMKGGLDDDVSPAFGRCSIFTMVEVEGSQIKDVSEIPNQFASAMSGAGIQAAGLIADRSAKAALAGNFGPNVAAVLGQSGVEMISASGMKVRDAVQKYLSGLDLAGHAGDTSVGGTANTDVGKPGESAREPIEAG